MQKIITFSPSVIIISLLISIGFLNSQLRTTDSQLGSASAIISAPNIQGRLAWEFERLKDPATGKIPANIREKELAYAATLPNDLMTSGKSSAVWNPRGPWNVGGRTRALAIDVTNENILLAGSCSGGMWRSTDGGQSWTPSTDVPHQSVSCIVQDKRAGHEQTWYIGTGEGYGASASATGAYYLGTGMYKSTDGGLTWNVLSSTTSGTVVFDNVWEVIWNTGIDVSDTTQDEVYACTYGAIWRSTNGGTSWSVVKGTTSGAASYFTDVAVSPTGVVYATLSSDGPQKGIWRSTDGTTYTNITPANFPATYDRLVIGISPSDENQVWFLGTTPGSGTPDTNFVGDVEWNSIWKYRYLSGNGSGTGGEWEDRSANLPTTGGPFDKFYGQGGYNLMVKVHPADTDLVFIGGTNLYRSTNGFTSPAQTTIIGGYEEGTTLPVVNGYLNHHPDQHDLLFLPSNSNVMISANDGGIFKTLDKTATPVVWTSLNNGYLTTMFYTVALDHATPGNNIIIAGAQDNGSWYTNSPNLTDPWVTPRGGDGSYCAIADNQAAYYFSIQNGKMMKAKLDPNGNVDSFARIDPIGGSNYRFINPYTLDPNNNDLMYLAAGKYLWRNDNLSGIPYLQNWDSISTNWTQWTDSVPWANIFISAVAVSQTPANRVYYGTNARRVYRVDNAHIGTPTPVDISSLTGPNAFPNSNVSCIAVDPANADNVIVSFSNYSIYSLFYTSDGGTTWQKIGGNLEQNSSGTGNGPSIRWVSIMPVSNGTVYLAGTSTGLYATSQLNGLSTVWTQQGTAEIGNAVVDMIDFRENDGTVLVATHTHGIYSSTITSTGDILSANNIQNSSNISSLSNFPNPFSESTTILFTLAKAGRTKVEVLDERGRIVEVLADASLPAGLHRYVFEKKNRRAGIYYCRVTAGSFTVSKTLVSL